MVQQPSWKANISTLVTEFYSKNKVEELFKTKLRGMGSDGFKFDVCLSPVLEVKEVYEQKHKIGAF
jgi:hypothetical protein